MFAAVAAGAAFASFDDSRRPSPASDVGPDVGTDAAISSRSGGRLDESEALRIEPRSDVTIPGGSPAAGSPDHTGSARPSARSLDFYGMEWTADVQPGDLETAASLGINAAMIDFDGTDPSRWIRQLDDAQRLGMRVVANYWPGRSAWIRTESGWEIPESSADFVRTVADHPALLAVYLLHEPYWNNGDRITTTEQRDLYRQVKAIADVPLYSAFAWSAFEQGVWTTGICDYCDSWFYPSGFEIDYDGAELERKLERVLDHFHSEAGGTDIRLVWILQAFESSRAGKQMPTYDEMIRLAETAIGYRSSSGQQVDAVFWYTWRHGPGYEEVLGEHPELQPAVREVKDRFVR